MDRLLGVVIILFLAAIPATTPSSTIYAITSSSCASCTARLATVRGIYPNATFITYDIAEPVNIKRFSMIVQALNVSYIPLPVVGVISSDQLRLIAAGGISAEAWRRITPADGVGVNIYVDDGNGNAAMRNTLEDAGRISDLERLIRSKDLLDVPGAVEVALPSLMVSALLDSLNVCMLGFFLVFISYISLSVSPGVAIKISTAFVVGALVARYATGLVLIQVFWVVPALRLVASLMILGLGIVRMAQYFTRRGRAIPGRLAEEINRRIEGASSPRAGFVAGFLTALFIITCSSPPYFMAISLISTGSNVAWGLVSMLIYNMVVLTPLLAIILCIFVLNLTTTLRLRYFVSSNRNYMNLLTGLALILMSILLLYQTLLSG